MATCRRHQAAVIDLISGAFSDDQAEATLADLEDCEHCYEGYRVHEMLTQTRLKRPEPAPGDLLEVRRNVLRTLRSEAPGRAANRSRFTIWDRLSHPIATLALVVLIVFGGIWVGRASLPASAPLAESSHDAPLLGLLQGVAVRNQVRDTVSSRYAFSDVRWTERPDGQVTLSFDVSTHLDVTLKRDDPLVTEILVQTLLTSSLGERLKAVARADHFTPRIREALIRTMQEDPNQAVRLEALNKLIDRQTPDLEGVLLNVLANEESVQMRLLAVDYLDSRDVDPAVLEEALTANQSPQNAAILWRTRSLEEEKAGLRTYSNKL